MHDMKRHCGLFPYEACGQVFYFCNATAVSKYITKQHVVTRNSLTHSFSQLLNLLRGCGDWSLAYPEAPVNTLQGTLTLSVTPYGGNLESTVNW